MFVMNRPSPLFHRTPAIYHAVVMHFLNVANRKPVFAALAAVFAVLTVAASAQTPAQTGAQAPAQTPAPAAAPATAPAPAQANGIYIATDPLAGVRYDQPWDLSVGMAYAHAYAGPNLREAANLGGLDVSGSRYITKRIRIEASGRAYLGTSGTLPAAHIYGESGVFVAQYMFLAGPEFLGPHNKHGALYAHALVGGVYGDFNKELGRQGTTLGPTGPAGFYDNQFALAGAFGGHIDLNRSAHWVFRITPDALLTGYDGTSQYPHTQWNFGISVGAEYKFKVKKK
jgi:hypothetical protein